MRYTCLVCGMRHSRPCDAGLACGILKGELAPLPDHPRSWWAMLARFVAGFRSATDAPKSKQSVRDA